MIVPPFYPHSEEELSAQPAAEYLPFTIRRVTDQADLGRAIDLRHLAYARHMPEFAEALKVPEQDDLTRDAVLLIAESKLDGSIIGTVRIQTNLSAPLNVEHSIALPAKLAGKTVAEVRRLAVAPGTSGRLVKMALLKSVYLYCVNHGLDWILVAARPPLDRMYEQLLLEDLLDGETFVPLPRENNVEHRVLGAEVQLLPVRFAQTRHPLHDFFVLAQHPDIYGTDQSPQSPRTIRSLKDVVAARQIGQQSMV
jgi:hypothetical protein